MSDLQARWLKHPIRGGYNGARIPRSLLRDTAEFLFSELQRVGRNHGVSVRELIYGRGNRGRAKGDLVVAMAKGEFFLRAFQQGIPAPLIAIAVDMSVRNCRHVRAQFVDRGLVV